MRRVRATEMQATTAAARSRASGLGRSGVPADGAVTLAAEVIRRLAGGSRLLLATDYDGTLSPIVATPDQAWLSPGVRRDLTTLGRAPGVHVSVVSGRDVADLQQRVGVPELIYGGCHGFEIEGPGLSFQHPAALAGEKTLRAIGDDLAARSLAIPGMYVERKRFGVAVHYRLVAPEHLRAVRREVARVLGRQASACACLRGAKVIEIQPDVKWTKGDCVRWIRDRVGGASGHRLEVLCLGDDTTDEHMFEAVRGEAITVRVARTRGASGAIRRLPDVASVHRLLAGLASWARGGP